MGAYRPTGRVRRILQSVVARVSPTGKAPTAEQPEPPTLTEQVLEKLRQRPDAPNDQRQFVDWLNARDPSEPPGLSRFLYAIWKSRPDLSESFPGIYFDPDARLRLQLWAHHFLAGETSAPPELIPTAPVGVTDIAAPAAVQPPGPLEPGVTIVGYLRATLGLGDAGRRLVRLAGLAGERVRSLPYDHTDSPLGIDWPDPDLTDTDGLDILIIAVNGSETERVHRGLGTHATHGRYVIALWFWELDDLPDDMANGFEVVDEVWVTSEFTADAVRRRAPADIAVRVLPLGADAATVAPPPGSYASRSTFGIPDGAVVVGTVFDYRSRIERKNPMALIEAWKVAFPEPDRSRRVLLVKSLNGHNADRQAEIVAAATGGRSDIVLLDQQLSAAERDELFGCFDIVASLHRSEGYGLTLLDAMHRGLPTMATAYSGNLAFMTPENSWLVPFTIIELQADAGSYAAGGRWADADTSVAADILHHLVTELRSPGVQERAKQGQRDVAPLMDGSAGSDFIRLRLAEIRADRGM